jgi:hypothetical protein
MLAHTGGCNLQINWTRQRGPIGTRKDSFLLFLKENQFLIILIIASVVLRAFWLKATVELDEGNPGYISVLWLRGILPYTPQNLMDAKGLFYYVLYMVSNLSSEPVICIRLINDFFYVVSVVTMFLLVKDWYGEKVGFVSALFYVFFMNTAALEGPFAIALVMSIPFVLFSVYFCNSYLKSGKRIFLLLSGVMMSLVLLIAPDQFVLFLLLPVMVWMNRKGSSKRILGDLSTLIVGTILPVFVVMVYYLCEGQFGSLISTWIELFTFTLPTARIWAQELPPIWSTFTVEEASPLILLSILGGIILVTERPKFSQFVALWMGLSLVRIVATQSVLGHDLLSIILPASILSGLALSLILENIRHRSKQSLGLFALVLVILSFAVSVNFQVVQNPGFTYDEVMGLSEYLKSHTTSGKLLMVGASTELYWLTGFVAPGGIYLDTTKEGTLAKGGTIPADAYEKLVTEVNNGAFDYIVRDSWAPDDALTQSIEQSHVNAVGNSDISVTDYALLKTVGILEVYEKKVTTYEIVNRTIISNNSTFWSAGALGTGQIGVPVLSDVSGVSTMGNESLRIVVGPGTQFYPYIGHYYEEYQDWSEYDYISLEWYGQNNGKRVQIILWTPDLENWAAANSITEDWSGWRQVIIPLTGFNAVEGTYNLTCVKYIQIWFGDNTLGTWDLGQVMLIEVR